MPDFMDTLSDSQLVLGSLFLYIIQCYFQEQYWIAVCRHNKQMMSAACSIIDCAECMGSWQDVMLKKSTRSISLLTFVDLSCVKSITISRFLHLQEGICLVIYFFKISGNLNYFLWCHLCYSVTSEVSLEPVVLMTLASD